MGKIRKSGEVYKMRSMFVNCNEEKEGRFSQVGILESFLSFTVI